MSTWTPVKTAEVKVDVSLNADGNIAVGTDTTAGTKAFTLKGFKVNGTPEQASTVLTHIVRNIAGGKFNANTMTYQEGKRGVVE